MTAKMATFVSLLVCLSICDSNLLAQKTVIWKGGTPGRETQWQCPKNWSGNNVPSEFSNVTIPDVSTSGMNYPVLNDVAEINSLRLEGNAVLTITSKGQLTVFNSVVAPDKENLKVIGLLKVLNGLEKSGHANIGQPD